MFPSRTLPSICFQYLVSFSFTSSPRASPECVGKGSCESQGETEEREARDPTHRRWIAVSEEERSYQTVQRSGYRVVKETAGGERKEPSPSRQKRSFAGVCLPFLSSLPLGPGGLFQQPCPGDLRHKLWHFVCAVDLS